MPGGGTTDYAVDAFHCAQAGQPLTCYLDENERLPMMSMHDAVRGAMELMGTLEIHPHSDLLQPQWVRFHPL